MLCICTYDKLCPNGIVSNLCNYWFPTYSKQRVNLLFEEKIPPSCLEAGHPLVKMLLLSGQFGVVFDHGVFWEIWPTNKLVSNLSKVIRKSHFSFCPWPPKRTCKSNAKWFGYIEILSKYWKFCSFKELTIGVAHVNAEAHWDQIASYKD